LLKKKNHLVGLGRGGGLTHQPLSSAEVPVAFRGRYLTEPSTYVPHFLFGTKMNKGERKHFLILFQLIELDSPIS
jgi:hypothetical protein